MTQFRKETVIVRLQKLNEFISQLEELQKDSKNDFCRDFKTNYSTKYLLTHSIEVVLDIASHILVNLFNETITDYSDAITKLGHRQIIPDSFAKQIQGMANFRNILVHEYLEIDEDKVYEQLKQGPSDFKRFIEYITEFLDEENL